MIVKQGKKLTVRQAEHLKSLKLNPENWLISKKLPHQWTIVNRSSGKPRTIPAP